MGIFDDIPVRDYGDDVTPSWFNTIRTRLIQAFPNITSITGDVVGTTDVQVLTNKTFDDELTLKELLAPPTNPLSTYKKLYAKDDGKVYTLNSDGTETEVGSGAGGGGSKNYFDQESSKFAGGTVGDWLTKLEETTTPYNVTTSNANYFLTSENTEEFTLTDERIDSFVIDVWKGTSTRDAILSIVAGSVVSPGATIWTTTITNSSMSVAQTTPKVYETGLTDFLTGTYHTRIDQGAGTDNLTTRADESLFGNPRTFTLNALRRGASTNLTLSATNVAGELLGKDFSLKLVKAAADAENEMLYLGSQTIDPIDRGKQLFGSFALKPISGYVSGDLILEVYDVTNSAVLYSGQEEDRELLNVTDPITFNYNAYLESTTAQIELRLKVNNTNTNGFTMTFDEFGIGPASVLPATFERREEITLVNSGANNLSGTIVVARTGNQVTITSPTGLTHTSASQPQTALGVIPSWALPPEGAPASVYVDNAGEKKYVAALTNGSLFFIYRDQAGTLANATTTGNTVAVSYTVPSTPHTMTTNELGLNSLTLSVGRVTGQNFSNDVQQTLLFDTIRSDKFNSYNPITGVFTAPKPGVYIVKSQAMFGGLNVNNGDVRVIISDDTGSAYNFSRLSIAGTTVQSFAAYATVTLPKGGTIRTDVRQTNGAGRATINSAAFATFMDIELKEDLTLIGAVRNDKISVDGAGNGGGTLTADVTNIDFTEVTDSSNAWSGSVFTAPRSSRFRFNGYIRYTAGTTSAVYAWVNGTQQRLASAPQASASSLPFSWEGVLEKGQTWSLRSKGTDTLSNSTGLHWISVSSDE